MPKENLRDLFRLSDKDVSILRRDYFKMIFFDLLSNNSGSGNGCSSVWYKAKYGSSTGYICSSYATVKEIKEEIINPDDYK